MPIYLVELSICETDSHVDAAKVQENLERYLAEGGWCWGHIKVQPAKVVAEKPGHETRIIKAR